MGDWAALALYAALGIVLAMHHERWQDEATTWLFARDAPLPQWFALTGREGIPAFGYLILLPFARAGLPYATLGAINLVIACGAAALLLLYSPFPRALRILVAFSYFLGYEYLAVARQYSLMVLLLFALAVVHRRRNAQPLIFAVVFALLVNTTVFALVIGALIGPVLAWPLLRERMPKRWIAIGIMAAGGIVAGLPMFLSIGTSPVAPFGKFNARAPLEAIALGIAPTWSGTASGPFYYVALVLAVVAFFGATATIAHDRTALLTLWLSWTGLLYIMTCVYQCSLRHFGLLFMTLLFAVWIGTEDAPDVAPRRRVLYGALYAASLLSIALAARMWRLDVLYEYSGSREAAQFLRDNHLENRPIAAHTPASAVAVLAYLPRRQFWFSAAERYGSYMIYTPTTYAMEQVPADAAARKALERFAGVPDLLLLSNVPLTIGPQYGLRLLYATRGRVFGHLKERYQIYERQSAR